MKVVDVEAAQFGYPTYKPLLDCFVAGQAAAIGARKIRRDSGWYWDLKPDLKPDEVLVL